MELDPKKDTRFQSVLANIMGGIKDLIQEGATEERRGERRDKEDLVSELSSLRVEFFWFSCFQDVYGQLSQQQAYEAYKTMRDSPFGQEFLQKNPLYTSSIDLALCKAANSIQRDRKASRNLPKQQQV